VLEGGPQKPGALARPGPPLGPAPGRLFPGPGLTDQDHEAAAPGQRPIERFAQSSHIAVTTRQRRLPRRRRLRDRGRAGNWTGRHRRNWLALSVGEHVTAPAQDFLVERLRLRLRLRPKLALQRRDAEP